MSRPIYRPRHPREVLLSVGRHCALEALGEPEAWAAAARRAWDDVLERMPPKPRRKYRRLTKP